jgi:hypothetical protein
MKTTYFGRLNDQKIEAGMASTTVWVGWSKVCFSAGARDFALIQNIQTGSGVHPPHLFSEYCGSWDMMLTISLHLDLKLRMSGAIPPLPHRPLWHGEVQLHLFYLLCDETIVSTSNQCTDVQWDSLSSPVHTVVFVLNWKAYECM